MAELPHIRLLMGPGTLPSQGADRLDLARYRRSGLPQLTGERLLELVPANNALGWGILMAVGFLSALSMWRFNRWLERQERDGC